MSNQNHIRTSPRRQAGVTLIELMVALAIGSFLMIGAVTVFMQSRTSFRVTESVARLQENARFAFDYIEPDIRMAQYWGLTSRQDAISNAARATEPNGIGDDSCGINWTIDLRNPVAASNNSYPWLCAATPAGAAAVANSDTLVVRHVTEDATTFGTQAPNTMYVLSQRFFPSVIINNGVIPSADYTAMNTEIHALQVHGYYVSDRDGSGNTVPTLRRKRLQADGRIGDEEILMGVEDMQIQLGVDTDPPGAANRGSIDRYVNANDNILNPAHAAYIPFARILAVRVWLRLRAERIENGFTDTTTYTYADRVFTPTAADNGFRRLLVMKTIYLRNARPPI
jgi:type IV pilus assembly protein PilW